MKILLLGGQSPSNKRWLIDFQKRLQEVIPEANITVHEYDF
ncbi:MAG TPA: hypothetical protein VK694_01415 [Verrucomicrobiae bacterium]|nr:hypothetical protein [Verrucomicrobiae bacterium]